MKILRLFRMLYYWGRIYRRLYPSWSKDWRSLIRYSYYYARPWMHKIDDDWVKNRRDFKRRQSR